MKVKIFLLFTISTTLMHTVYGHRGSLISRLNMRVDKQLQQTQVTNSPKEQNVEDLIESVFELPSTNIVTNINLKSSVEIEVTENAGEQPNDCECVPRDRCKNNTIDEDIILDARLKNNQCRNPLQICCSEPIKSTKKPQQIQRQCGIHNPEGIGFRINPIDGNESQFGEFPWMVAILFEATVEGNRKFNIYQCGGSLIHPKVVLTAAHCVVERSKDAPLKIRVGEWDTQTVNELYPHQDRTVESITVHDEFFAGMLYNDIALLFLEKPVDIAENVNVMCLPPENIQIDRSNCMAAGWGKDMFGQDGSYQVILKKVELPIVSRDQCVNSLRNTRLGKDFELHKSFICAGGEQGKDTCKGDGGSPLVCPISGKSNQFQQVGVVSWGIGCGEIGTPGVYASVSYFRKWIDEQMAQKNLERSFYIY